ncbi:MAG: hypothetical protein ACRDSH_13040, partial [Pseudonocardiaceae bacterium]
INYVRRAVGMLTISSGKPRSIVGCCDTDFPQVEDPDDASSAVFEAGYAVSIITETSADAQNYSLRLEERRCLLLP